MTTNKSSMHNQAQLQAFLLDLASQFELHQAMQRLWKDGMDQAQRAMASFDAEVRGEYEHRTTILYGSRPSRVFEIECRRLRYRATVALVDAVQDHKKAERMERFRDKDGQLPQKALLLPIGSILEAMATRATDLSTRVGEDLYLYLYNDMIGPDERKKVDDLIASGLSPPQSVLACIAVHALIDQAIAAWTPETVSQAYTFLMDANHLLGMQEGAKFVMRRAKAMAPRIQGAAGGKKTNEDIAILKEEARLHFNTLPKGKDEARTGLWQSAEKAANAIWKVLQKKHPRPGSTSTRGYNAVLTVCEELQRNAKAAAKAKQVLIPTSHASALDMPEG